MTLTNRETEVLQLIAAELTTAQIADTLGVSVPTIETHRRNLFRKAGVRSVAGLVKQALRQGIVHRWPDHNPKSNSQRVQRYHQYWGVHHYGKHRNFERRTIK